jgi:hypothetical protein
MKLLPALRVPGDTEAARATGCSVRLSGSIVCQRGTGIASDIRRYRVTRTLLRSGETPATSSVPAAIYEQHMDQVTADVSHRGEVYLLPCSHKAVRVRHANSMQRSREISSRSEIERTAIKGGGSVDASEFRRVIQQATVMLDVCQVGVLGLPFRSLSYLNERFEFVCRFVVTDCHYHSCSD